MSLVAVFCSFVRRLPASLNVQARPIGFPGILLAGITHRTTEHDSIQWTYVNVFAGGKILHQSDLQAMVQAMGLTMQPDFLRSATALEMAS